MSASTKTISKFLSLVLRHEPERIGLALDTNGWADVDDLIARVSANGPLLDRAMLDRVVAENDKMRFAFSDDGRRIRASQGHSVNVDLALTPTTPPAVLYHGTADKNLASIRARGLIPGERQHVHLAVDVTTATKVGQRHGSPVVLAVMAGPLSASGQLFYVSANGVWLTEHVSPAYLRFPD